MHSNKILSIAVLAAFVAMAFPMTASGATVEFGMPDAGTEGTEQYIVAFHEMPDARVGDSYQGAEIVHLVPQLRMITVETQEGATFKARVNLDDNARYVTWNDPNYATLNLVPDDSLYNDPGHWGSKRIGGEAAWDVSTGSTAIKVAMIDSGLEKSHEDIARYTQGYDFRDGDNDPDDSSGCNYHGTHTSGTAGATLNNGAGIAGMSQHTIMPLKIFGKGFFGCGTTTQAIIDAMVYSADNGAHLSSNSWGGGSSDSSINDAIDYAYQAGVVIVGAAGNSGPCTNCVGQPWKDNPTKTIVVSASSSDDSFASFSSEGPEVDVIAPGDDIISTTQAPSSYATYDGTSMATPHVTGALALYMAVNGVTDHAGAESALQSTSEDLGLSADRQGFGLVRADSLVGSSGSTNSPPTASFTYACTDLTCDFDGTGSSDSDGTISSYEWDFGDGTTATGSTVTHTFGASGDYTVTLTVTDDAGATDTDSQVVSVSDGTGGGDTMHVHDIDHYRKGNTPYFQIWIYDSAEAAVSGATVSVEVCKDGGSCATGSGDTGSDGSVTFKWRNQGSGTYTTCVTDVTHATLTYDSTQDHASSGSCHTETV